LDYLRGKPPGTLQEWFILFSMAAKLPPSLTRPKEPVLANMNTGETGYVSQTDMGVNAEGECFLNPDAALVGRASDSIQVTRREDGYHVVVIAHGWLWTPFGSIKETAVPVATITEDYDPKLVSPLLKMREKYENYG
jgi:hypothetical protein